MSSASCYGKARCVLFLSGFQMERDASNNQPAASCDHGGYMKSNEIKELFDKFERVDHFLGVGKMVVLGK